MKVVLSITLYCVCGVFWCCHRLLFDLCLVLFFVLGLFYLTTFALPKPYTVWTTRCTFQQDGIFSSSSAPSSPKEYWMPHGQRWNRGKGIPPAKRQCVSWFDTASFNLVEMRQKCETQSCLSWKWKNIAVVSTKEVKQWKADRFQDVQRMCNRLWVLYGATG